MYVLSILYTDLKSKINIKLKSYGRFKFYIPQNAVRTNINSFLYNSLSSTFQLQYEPIDGLNNIVLLSENLTNNRITCDNNISFRTFFNKKAYKFDDIESENIQVDTLQSTKDKIYIKSQVNSFKIGRAHV